MDRFTGRGAAGGRVAMGAGRGMVAVKVIWQYRGDGLMLYDRLI